MLCLQRYYSNMISPFISPPSPNQHLTTPHEASSRFTRALLLFVKRKLRVNCQYTQYLWSTSTIVKLIIFYDDLKIEITMILILWKVFLVRKR